MGGTNSRLEIEKSNVKHSFDGFIGSNLLKIHTPCAHEPLPGRPVLLHSLNAEAERQRRPTD